LKDIGTLVFRVVPSDFFLSGELIEALGCRCNGLTRRDLIDTYCRSSRCLVVDSHLCNPLTDYRALLNCILNITYSPLITKPVFGRPMIQAKQNTSSWVKHIRRYGERVMAYYGRLGAVW